MPRRGHKTEKHHKLLSYETFPLSRDGPGPRIAAARPSSAWLLFAHAVRELVLGHSPGVEAAMSGHGDWAAGGKRPAEINHGTFVALYDLSRSDGPSHI